MSKAKLSLIRKIKVFSAMIAGAVSPVISSRSYICERIKHGVVVFGVKHYNAVVGKHL